MRLNDQRRRIPIAAGRPTLQPASRTEWRSGWLWRRRLGGNEDPKPQVLSGVRDERLRRLEAVLFVAREPLTSRKLSQFANLADGTEARTLIRRLNTLYDASGRAFRVEEVAGGFQLLSRKRFARWLRRLTHTPSELRLSAPAMETLAVVAYRQPVLRADIEAIRGVNCGEILRQLMERDMVRISGRSEELGRPYLYSTTKRFLQLFGLRDLDQLPRAEMLRADAAKSTASDPIIRNNPDQPGDPKEEETDVSITLEAEPHLQQLLAGAVAVPSRQPTQMPRAEDEFDDDDDLDDDEDDDIDDVDDDEELDEDLEEDEWEEVDEDDDEWEDDDDDDDEEEDEDEVWE